MRKLYLSLILAAVCTLSAAAQTGKNYYVDLVSHNNEKYYLEWNSEKGLYDVTIPQLEGDFIIRADPGTGNDNIFGAGQSAGVTIGTVMNLVSPGNNLKIEGGGIIYNALIEFDPIKMTMVIADGSTTRPSVRNITAKIITADATSPETGTINYRVDTELIDNPLSLVYDATIEYNDADGEPQTDTQSLSGTLSGSFNLENLKIGSSTPVRLTVTTTYEETTYTSSDNATIVTPEVPILIGQIAGHEWDPAYGEQGNRYTIDRSGMSFFYIADLVGQGEFSFITKLGTNSSDWATVNSHPRYAPSESRQAITLDRWYDYSRFDGSTENAWYPENFTPGKYVIVFDYGRQQILAIRYTTTGMDVPGATNDMNRRVNVYTISGRLVRSNADINNPASGLPAGIYIVDGHKIMTR